MKRLLRAPLLHFFVAASIALLGQNALSARFSLPPESSGAPIQLSSAWLASLCRDELARSGAYARDDELAAIVRRAADDELLLREAIARGYDRTDPVVGARLVSNLRFVSPGEQLSPESAFTRAFDLGMQQRDVVARRRLIGRLRLETEGRARQRHPSNDELRAFLEQNKKRYLLPERVRISHIFFAPNAAHKNQERRDAAAHQLLEKLSAGGLRPPEVEAIGDPFLEGRDLPSLSPRELTRIFGADFTGAVKRAPTQQWIGPLHSAFGSHLVWIHERLPLGPPAFESIRERLIYDWWQERGRAELAREILRLRRRYPILLGGVPLAKALAAIRATPASASAADCRQILARPHKLAAANGSIAIGSGS